MDTKQDLTLDTGKFDGTILSKEAMTGLPHFFRVNVSEGSGVNAQFTVKILSPLNVSKQTEQERSAKLFSGKSEYFPKVFGNYIADVQWRWTEERCVSEYYCSGDMCQLEAFVVERDLPTTHLVLENLPSSLNEDIKDMANKGQRFTTAGQYQIFNALIQGIHIVHNQGCVFSNGAFNVLTVKNEDGSYTAKLSAFNCVQEKTEGEYASNKDIWNLGITCASVLIGQPVESIPDREHNMFRPFGGSEYFLQNTTECQPALRNMVYSPTGESCLRARPFNQATAETLVQSLSFFAQNLPKSIHNEPAIYKTASNGL